MKTKNIFNRKENPDISKRSGFSNIFRWKILMVLACLFFGLSGVSARVITITKGNNAEISTTSIEIGSGSCGSFDVTFAQHQNYTELTLDVAQADFSGFTSTGYASNYQINAYSAENNTKQKVQVNNGNSGAMTTIWIKVDSDNKVSIHPTNTCISSTPTINITCPSPTSFSTTAGTVGSNQSFTVTGSNLTDNVSITTNRQDLFELSANGGSTWNSTVTLTQSGGSVTGTNNVQIRLKSGLNALSSTSVTLTVSSTGATSQTCSLTATVTAPSASITRTCPASSAFSTTTNAASASQSFTVSGSNLTNDLIVSTNNTNLFEVSKDNSAWSNSVSYTPSGGSVSTTTVYVRLKNGLSVQSNTSVTLTVSSTNATSQTCSLTATVTSSGGSNITVASTGSTATSVDCGGRNVWKLSRTGSSNITIDITNAGIANTGAWKLTSSFSGDFGTDKVNNVSHPGGDIYIEIITSTSPKEVIINSEPGCSGCTSTAPSLDFSSLCVGEVRTLPTGDGGTWSIKSGALLTVSGNAGNQSVTANAVGSAALIYTKAGCTASSDVNITVNPNPSQPVIQEKTFVCGTNIENFLQNYQNMKLYSGSCKNGTPLTAGSFTSNTNYYVTQTDANGCESSCIELEVSVEQFKPVFKRNTKTVEPGTKVSILNELVNNKVDGATIKWYKGTNCTGTLIDDPANTILENGATYYATQTVSGCEVSACSDGAITVTVNPVCESNYSIKIWGTQVTINGVQRESSESTRPVVSLCAIRDCPEIYEFTLTSSGDDSNFSIYTGDSNNEQNRVIFYSGNETTHEGTRPTINANGKPIGLSYNRCGDAEALPGNPAGEDSNVGCLIYTPSSVTNTKNYFLVVDGNNRYVTDDTTNISCSDCPPFEGTNTTQLCMGVEKQLSPATGWTLVSGNATLNTETGIVITDANAAGGNTISLQHCSGESLNLTVYSMPTIDENGHPSTAEIPAKCKNSETFGELTLAFASGASTNRSYQWYIISGSAIPGNPGTGGTPIANATSQNYTPDISQLAVGTYYFYCVIKNNQNANANVCEVTSNISAAHTVTDCNTPDPGIECPALAISICQGINPGSISSINPCGNYCVFSFIVASYNTPGLEIREGGSRITSETWSIDNLSNLTFGYATRCGFLNVTTTDDAILGQSNVTVYAKIETSPTKKITFSLEPFCVCPNEPTINHNASSGTASPTVCITDGTLEDIVYDLTYAAGATIKFTDKSNQATVSESSIGLSFNANASTATIIQIGALVAGEYEYVITTTQEDEACPSATAKGTITINAAITAGSIQTNTITVCENETVTFSNLTSPSGGTGRYTYTWEYNDGEGWKPVSNPVNIQGYNSLPLTKTTDFRRLVNDDLCTGAAVPTEAITITVNPALAPGSIIPASQTVCHNAMATINTEVPTELVLSTQENITYQWQRKVGEVWTDIVGATNGATFTSDALTTTMQFRRKAAYSSTGTCAVYTDPVTVTVIPQLVAGMISAPEAICEEENATFTSTATASGGTGSYQYQWQSKTGAGAWTSLGEWNSEATTYIATSLNSTTSFRRSVRNSDGTCDTVCSNVITISVYQTPVAGTITPVADVCEGGIPALFVSVNHPTEGTGSFNYQWYSKAESAGEWTEIINGTGQTYQPEALSETTMFKLVASNSNGSCAAVEATTEVEVHERPALAVSTTPTENCEGPNASAEVSVDGSRLVGTQYHRWYTSLEDTTPIKIGGNENIGNNYSNPGAPVLTDGFSETYYVEIFDPATGCFSATRTPATVTVQGRTFNVVPTTIVNDEIILGTPLTLHDFCGSETENFAFGTGSDMLKNFTITGSCLADDVTFTVKDNYQVQVLFEGNTPVGGSLVSNGTIRLENSVLNEGKEYLISVSSGGIYSEFTFDFTPDATIQENKQTQKLCVAGRPDEPNIDILVSEIAGLGYFVGEEIKERRFTVVVTNLGTGNGNGGFYQFTGNTDAFQFSVGTSTAPEEWKSGAAANTPIELQNGRNYLWVRAVAGLTVNQNYEAVLTLINKAGDTPDYIVDDELVFKASIYPEKTGDYCDERDAKVGSGIHQYSTPDYTLMDSIGRIRTTSSSASMNANTNHYLYLDKPTGTDQIGISSGGTGSIYVVVQGPVPDSYTINLGNVNGPIHIMTYDVDSMNVVMNGNNGAGRNYVILDGHTRYHFSQAQNQPSYIIIQEKAIVTASVDLQIGNNSYFLNKGMFTVGTGTKFGNGFVGDGNSGVSSNTGFSFNGSVFINEGTMNIKGSFAPANNDGSMFVNKGVVFATGHLVFNGGSVCLAEGACFTVDKGVGATSAFKGSVRGRGGFHFKEHAISYNAANSSPYFGATIVGANQSISISWTSDSHIAGDAGWGTNGTYGPINESKTPGDITDWGASAITQEDNAGGCQVCHTFANTKFEAVCAVPGRVICIDFLGMDMADMPNYIWHVSNGGNFELLEDEMGERDDSVAVTWPPTFNGESVVTISYDYGDLLCNQKLSIPVKGSAPLLWKGTEAETRAEGDAYRQINPKGMHTFGVWNNPDNWDVAVIGVSGKRDIESVAKGENTFRILPSGCTDVYLRAFSDTSHYYPILQQDVKVKDIYFGAGASVGRIHHLIYQKAYVDMTIPAWSTVNSNWHMVSPPLKEMHSGDYTYSAADAQKDGADYRIASYIRYFAIKETDEGYRGDWTKSIASTTEDLNLGMGYALRYSTNKTTPGGHIFKFPKNAKESDTIAHRFIAEELNESANTVKGRIDSDFNVPIDINRGNWAIVEGGSGMKNHGAYLIIGNPFMSHLDLHAFFHDNQKYINPAISRFVTNFDDFGFHMNDPENDLKIACEGGISNMPGENAVDDTHCLRYVPPMQAFFVSLTDNAIDLENFTLKFTLDHTVSSTSENAKLRSTAINTGDRLRLQVTQDERSSLLAFVSARRGASNDYFSMEDAQKLFSNDAPLQVYTFAGDVPSDMNTINADSLSGLIIPIEIRTKTAGKVTLSISGITSFTAADNIWLIDSKEGTRTSLFDRETFEFDLAAGATGDRFYLDFEQEPKDDDDPGEKTEVTDTEALADHIYAATNGNMLNVLSKGEPIEAIVIHDLSSRIVYQTAGLSTDYFSYRLPDVVAVYLVKVITGSQTITKKVIVK